MNPLVTEQRRETRRQGHETGWGAPKVQVRAMSRAGWWTSAPADFAWRTIARHSQRGSMLRSRTSKREAGRASCGHASSTTPSRAAL